MASLVSTKTDAPMRRHALRFMAEALFVADRESDSITAIVCHAGPVDVALHIQTGFALKVAPLDVEHGAHGLWRTRLPGRTSILLVGTGLPSSDMNGRSGVEVFELDVVDRCPRGTCQSGIHD